MKTKGEVPKKERIGPTMTDTLHAQKLVKFLRENTELIGWLGEKMRTKEGRHDLVTLFNVELLRKGK